MVADMTVVHKEGPREASSPVNPQENLNSTVKGEHHWTSKEISHYKKKKSWYLQRVIVSDHFTVTAFNEK